jgi:hypothetical protein
MISLCESYDFVGAKVMSLQSKRYELGLRKALWYDCLTTLTCRQAIITTRSVS